MGTRSFIAQKTDAGIQGVYCHWDGYLSHNGRILRDHYSTPEKLARLIAHGALSSLAPEIGGKHDFDHHPDGECNFYHRDREESWEQCQPQSFNTIKALLTYAAECGCEYVYLFDAKGWRYAVRGAQFFGMSDGSPFSKLRPLPRIMEK